MRLEGPIDEEQLWGDEITPKAFRDDLESEDGDLTLWINSPGGNVFAASEIYSMLRDYKGRVTVKIDSIAASAASVVAMAGDEVLISPTGMLMIHDPSTVAMGNSKDMEHAIDVLNEVKEAIINAYAAKSGLRRGKIAELMSNETWMNAKKAVELGFADGILFEDGNGEDEGQTLGGSIEEEPGDKPTEPEEKKEPENKSAAKSNLLEPHLFFARQMDLAILNRLKAEAPAVKDTAEPGADSPAEETPSGKETPEAPIEEPKDEATPARETPPADTTPPVEDTGTSGDRPEGESTGPVMTLSGKTTDGSVPYTVLKRQLDLLK